MQVWCEHLERPLADCAGRLKGSAAQVALRVLQPQVDCVLAMVGQRLLIEQAELVGHAPAVAPP